MSTTFHEARVPAPTAPAAAARSRRSSAAAPLLVGVGFVALWWLTAIILDSSVFPDPATAVERLLVNLENPRFRSAVGDTIVRLAIAYGLVVVIGASIGFSLGLSRFWSDAISPIVYALYSVPKIVLFPLFLLFLGIGSTSVIAFAFFSGVLPVILMVMSATGGVPRLPLKLAASLRMRGPTVVRKVVLPSVLPAFASALRLAFGLTFLGIVIAEMFSGTAGLGSEILRNVPLARMGDIVGAVLLIVLIALGPATALLWLERRIHVRFGGGEPGGH